MRDLSFEVRMLKERLNENEQLTRRIISIIRNDPNLADLAKRLRENDAAIDRFIDDVIRLDSDT